MNKFEIQYVIIDVICQLEIFFVWNEFTDF